ncbi:XdhC family protein [Rhodococcus sp. NBC_00297]
MKSLKQWYVEGSPVGLATVVRARGSAVHGVGAMLAVGPHGQAVGGVSGGCVEGVVFDAASAAALDGTRDRLWFGANDTDPFAVALTCGGEIEIVVERLDCRTRPHYRTLLDHVGCQSAVCEIVDLNATSGPVHLVVSPSEMYGSFGTPEIDAAATRLGREMLHSGTSGLAHVESDGAAIEVFVHSFPGPPRMLVFGGLDLADAVAQIAKLVGYRVVVCDARPVFATASRFPHADEVVHAWPHQYLQQQSDAGSVDPSTVLCVLTHDSKFDEPLLEVAVRTAARYIGVLGSRRTHENRITRLLEHGLSVEETARLHSPIGLDIGGHTTHEMALSIVAEIVASGRGRSGGALRRGVGSIRGSASTM